MLSSAKKVLWTYLQLSVYAPFWLVNKTGLPLVFRQDNARTDAAGQFEEHEQARCVMPLLFSYADKEANSLYVFFFYKCQSLGC